MSAFRFPKPLHNALRLPLATLMLTLALPAAANVVPKRPLIAPLPIQRVAVPKRNLVTIAKTRVEAESIASASPSLLEAARRLKQRGMSAAVSLPAIRSVFRASDRENFRSMVAAGYAKTELVDAFKQLDNLEAAAMGAKLAEVGEPTRASALQLVRLYPGLTFDTLFAVLKAQASVDAAFTASAEALALDIEQIVNTAARYHQSRQFALDQIRFYPEADTVAALVRVRHLGTPEAVIWSRLLAVGYPPDMVFQQVAVADFDRSGRALDAVAVCLAQHFPNRNSNTNPTVDITIALDASARHDARQAGCYATFLQSLRGQSVNQVTAAQLAENFVACVPAQAPTCAAERPAVVRSILNGAGYR